MNTTSFTQLLSNDPWLIEWIVIAGTLTLTGFYFIIKIFSSHMDDLASRMITHRKNLTKKTQIIPLKNRYNRSIIEAIDLLKKKHQHHIIQIQKEHEYLNNIIKKLPLPLILIDENFTVNYINEKAQKLFPLLKTSYHLSQGIRDPEFLHYATGQADQESPSRAFIMYMGNKKALKIKRQTFHHPNGSSMIQLTFHNVADKKNIEQIKINFAADAGHELRTPLTIQRGLIETLNSHPHDRQLWERFLPIMETQTERMIHLVEGLLKLSDIELQKNEPAINHIEISEVLDDVVKYFEIEAQKTQHQIIIKNHVDHSGVKAEKKDLFHIFESLIENSLKYSAPKSSINITISKTKTLPASLTYEQNQTFIHIKLQDKGKGISAQHLPRLTQRFYRADHQKNHQTGTGLGLAIVKHIIQRYNGHFSISSQENVGSIFSVYLPHAPE